MSLQNHRGGLLFLLLLGLHSLALGLHAQDQTSSRTNTLFDDADDIQRQLDNEARDRIKYGRPKTIWVFHFPTHIPEHNSIVETSEDQMRCPRHLGHSIRDDEDDDGDDFPTTAPCPASEEWDYLSQANWAKSFPECGGKSQSPVDLPTAGLIRPRGARPLLFQNHNVVAQTMTLMNDGRQMILFGQWRKEQRPLIYGGAAHSRRYLFHSMVVHLPSEHVVGSMVYPMETQVYYVSAEYQDMSQALGSTNDQQAILAVVNLYRYGNHTHQGMKDILDAAKGQCTQNKTIKGSTLRYFNPPFKEYACYQGSMTSPPCTESVLWLVRGRTLHIQRGTWERAQAMMNENPDWKRSTRFPQPLNDRKVYFFK